MTNLIHMVAIGNSLLCFISDIDDDMIKPILHQLSVHMRVGGAGSAAVACTAGCIQEVSIGHIITRYYSERH